MTFTPKSTGAPDNGTVPKGQGFFKRHRRTALTLLGAAAVVGFIYYAVPQIAGLGPTLRRLRAANTAWIVIGVFVDVLSIAGEIVLFRGVFPVAGLARGRSGRRPGQEGTQGDRGADWPAQTEAGASVVIAAMIASRGCLPARDGDGPPEGRSA